MQVGSRVRVAAPFDTVLPGVYVIVGISETGAWQIDTGSAVTDFDAVHLILVED